MHEQGELSLVGDKTESDLVVLIGFEDPGLGEALVVAALGWAILAIVSTVSQQAALMVEKIEPKSAAD